MSEDDNIDRSQWQEWDENNPLINPFRKAHGDLITGNKCEHCEDGKQKTTRQICQYCHGKGWLHLVNAAFVDSADIKYAQAQVRNILNFLWEMNRISGDQYGAGQVFEAWRNQHRVALGLQKPISSEMEPSARTKLRAYGYVLILKKLSMRDHKAVAMAIDTFSTPHTQDMAIRHEKNYQSALENLSDALEDIRDEIVHLEGLSEEELSQLSEHRLKKLLAERFGMRNSDATAHPKCVQNLPAK